MRSPGRPSRSPGPEGRAEAAGAAAAAAAAGAPRPLPGAYGAFPWTWRLNRVAWWSLFLLGSLLMPRPLQLLLGHPVAWLLARLLRGPREAVRENLRVVAGGRCGEAELDALARRTFYNVGIYILDFLALAHGSGDLARELIAAESGGEHLERALRAGRGAILATAHLGNWELGGFLLGRRNVPLHVLQLKVASERIEAFRERIRRRVRVKEIVVDGGPAGGAFATIEVTRALRRGEVIALLADRPAGPAIEVPFFGRPRPFPFGPALLSRLTGAPILPTCIAFDGGRGMRYRVTMEEPIVTARTDDRDKDLREATEALVRAMERWIARHPDQWFTFYPYFRATPSTAAAPPIPRRCGS